MMTDDVTTTEAALHDWRSADTKAVDRATQRTVGHER